MVVGGRMVVEGEDERSRKKRDPGEQEEETRGVGFGEDWRQLGLLLWSFSKGR